MDALRFERQGAAVLRLAFATPLAMAVAKLAGLDLAFMASVLVLALAPAMTARPPIKVLVLLLLVVVLFSSGLVWLMAPLLENMSIYLTALGALLFALFALQGHPRFGPIVALALPLTVALAPLIPVSTQYIGGLARLLGLNALIAVTLTLLAWLVFPGPAAPAAAAPAALPRRSLTDAAVCAVIMLGLIGATLALDAQTAMRMLMIACSVLAVSDPRTSQARAAMTVGATLAGALAAWLLTGLIALAATTTMAVLIAALVPLLIGRRLADPAEGPFWITSLTAMWVLLGFDGQPSVAKLVSFTALTLAGVAVAIGLRHTLCWHFDRRARAA